MIRSHEEEGKLQVDPDNKHQTFYMNKTAFEPTTIARKGLVSPESEVERFKEEREARIRGITQAQSIQMEEEARRARDLALAKERAKAEAKARLEKEREVTIDSQNDDNLLTGSRQHGNVDNGILMSEQDLNIEYDIASVGDEAVFDQEEEALSLIELDRARLASQLETSRLQLEEEERHNLELEEARISSKFEASRLKKEKDERLAARLGEVRLASESETARLQREEEEEARNSSELQTARLREEKEERLSAKLAEARIASENEEARITREKKERLAQQARLEKEERQRIAAEQESIRLQAEENERLRIEAEQQEVVRLQAEENERLRIEAEEQEVDILQAEENERLRIQAEQQEVARLQAEENERLRIEAEERKVARLQAEENERLRIEAEQQEVARLHAEKQRSLRIEAERQESAARLQVEDDAFHGPTPIIAKRTSRPGSAALRRGRGPQEEREGQLRGIMYGLAASYSGDDRSVSSPSFNSMETSLFSHSKNLASGKNLHWEDVSIFVCFGLLTTADKCPREGVFDPNDTSVNSKILFSVMKKVKKLSRSVIEEKSGNILMKCNQPFVTSVKRDGKCQSVPIFLQNVSCSGLICISLLESFNESGRPGVVRSLVHATIPLKLTDVHEELNSTTKIVAKVMVRQALVEGIHRGYFAP